MLRIITLGGLSVTHPDRELAGAALQPRRLALLAVLARAGDRGVTRERLLSLFWPDDDEERARRALTQALYALRRDLGTEGAIVGSREMRLEPALIASDVGDFTLLLKRGRLAEAVAGYGGPFLQGFHLVGAADFERWADDERSAIGHEHARALERLAAAAEREGAHRDAARHWRALATLDPLNAAVAVRLMRALEATGDRAGALVHAHIYEALVSQELELPPDRAVLELAAALRAAPAMPVPAMVSVVSVSEQSENELASNPAESALQPSRDTVIESSASAPPPAIASPRRRPLLGAIAATVVALLALGIAAMGARNPLGDVAQLRVGRTTRVTFEETLELDPTISPDGRMIAYAGGTEGSMRLFVRQLDAGRAIPVSTNVTGDHRRPRWSPDGTRILFQANRGIWMVPSLGGTARAIVDAPTDSAHRAAYPAWSPDGRQLAWADEGVILVRAVDGGPTRRVGAVQNAHSLAWSPDGRFLAVASNNIPFVYGAVGAMRFAAPSIGNIAPGLVYVVSVASGEATLLTEPEFLSTSPEWLGDSRRLVYVSNRDGARDVYAQALDGRGHPTGQPVRLTTGLDVHTVSASTDGRTLAYTTFRQRANIWSVPVSSRAPVGLADAVQVTDGAQTVEAMDVSPDGAWIAFDSDRDGRQGIFRLRTGGGGEPERVAATSTDDFHPAWSPDGRSLAFYSMRAGIRRGAVVPANGGNARFVGVAGGSLEEHSPVWTPDGAHLWFHRFGEQNPDLYQIARTGDSSWSAPVRVTEHGGIWPTFSADGSELAYFSAGGEISVMRAADGERSRHVLVHVPAMNGLVARYARWAPGQRALYVRASDSTGAIGLWSVPIDGGAWRLLVRFDDPRRPPARPEFATDGRRFYFTLAERTADVWTVQLLSR